MVSWPTDSQTVPMASSCPTPIATNTAPSRTSHRYTTGETYVKVAGRPGAVRVPDHRPARSGDRCVRVPQAGYRCGETVPRHLHNTGQYENNRCECDHGRLKARLRPIRGLKTDRTASVRDPKGTRSTRIPHDRRSANATVPYTIIVK